MDSLYPHSMRFTLSFGEIDVGLDTKDVAKMDGSAFHKAADMMNKLKKSKLLFTMSTHDEIMDIAIKGQINLIFFLRKKWSKKQYEVIKEYEKVGSQYEVAKALSVTQQAVSNILKRSMWKEIKNIEEDLNRVLHLYMKKQHLRGVDK